MVGVGPWEIASWPTPQLKIKPTLSKITRFNKRMDYSKHWEWNFFFSRLYKQYNTFATAWVQFPGPPVCFFAQEMFLTLQCTWEHSHWKPTFDRHTCSNIGSTITDTRMRPCPRHQRSPTQVMRIHFFLNSSTKGNQYCKLGESSNFWPRLVEETD